MNTVKQIMTEPTLEKHLHGHTSRVTGLCFDPSSKQLVSSSHDNTLMVWNFKDKIRAFKFIGHKDNVTDVCFSPMGQLIASSSLDTTVRLWTPTIGGASGQFRPHSKAVQSVHFSYDGLSLLTASYDKSIKEWSVQKRTFLAAFTGHTNWVKSARYSHSANTIATASDDRSIKVFDRQSHKCIHTFCETGVPQRVIFHPNDNYIAAALSNNTIKLYDLRILKQLQLYKCHEDGVMSVAFHPNGNYLFSVSEDGTTKILDVLEGRSLYTLEGNGGPLSAVAASPDGNYFAVGGKDGQILLWKANFDIISDEDSICDIKEELETDDRYVSDRENISQNELSSELEDLTLRDSNETCSSADGSLKILSRKVDDIYELTYKMKNTLAQLDARCRKLEDLYSDPMWLK